MTCILLDNKFYLLGLSFGLLYPIPVVSVVDVEQDNRGTNEVRDKDSVEERFQVSRVKFDRDRE